MINKRLLVVYDVKYYLDQADKLYTNGCFATYVDLIAPMFRSINLCGPLAPSPDTLTKDIIVSKNVVLKPLPYYKNTHASIKYMGKLSYLLYKYALDCDAIYLRTPTILSTIVYPISIIIKKPLIIHVVGDLRSQYDTNIGSLWSLIAAGVVNIIEIIDQFIINQTPTIVQGKDLFRKHKRNYNRVINIMESTVSDTDIKQYIPIKFDMPIRLLYIGGLKTTKGVEHLLRGARILKDRQLDFILDIVGTGPLETKLKKISEEMGLQDKVIFHGHASIDHVWEFYDNSSIFCFPSLAEGTPRALIEAMARNIPIITTNVGGITELIQDGVNGIVIKPGDGHLIASAVLNLINNVQYANKLIRNGNLACRRFTKESHLRNIIPLFREILSLSTN